MAVRLSSDLVADVMRNADPVRQGIATARLQKAGGQAGVEFAQALEAVPSGTSPASASAHTSLGDLGNAETGTSVAPTGSKPAAYEGFERMVLRNLFETLLPDEKSGSFGEGPSAGIWRSLAADQLAGVYAAKGGIGIAAMLTSSGQQHGPRRDAEWPYFALNDISAVRG